MTNTEAADILLGPVLTSIDPVLLRARFAEARLQEREEHIKSLRGAFDKAQEELDTLRTRLNRAFVMVAFPDGTSFTAEVADIELPKLNYDDWMSDGLPSRGKLMMTVISAVRTK